MKMKLNIFLLLSIVPLTFACCSDEERLLPEPYEVLVSIDRTDTLDFDHVVDVLLSDKDVADNLICPYQDKLDLARRRSRDYSAHVVRYNTTAPDGTPIVASGVVYYPLTGRPKGVLEAVSYNKTKLTCPSKQPACVEFLTGMAGYIVIIADQIGAGATEDMPFTYFYHDNIATVSADLRRAATELVRNEYGRPMPKTTYIAGFSLAASGACALARHYDLHPELGVKVSELWIGGGAYQPLVALQHLLEVGHTQYAFMPYVLYSMNHYDSLGLNLGEVFTGELSEHYREWCDGQIEVYDLTDMLGPDISRYLNLEFFRSGNAGYERLCDAVGRKAVHGDWKPSCKVYIWHGVTDEYVPFACSQQLADELKAQGASVELVATDGGHIDNGIAMGLKFMDLLYSW